MSLFTSSGLFLPTHRPVEPLLEVGAYEALWLDPKASFKTIADRIRAQPEARPSDFVDPSHAMACAHEVLRELEAQRAVPFGVRIHGAGEYPMKLRDARHPVELLYYRGTWDLVDARTVAVVGTRRVSNEGRKRAAKLARELVKAGFVIVSGLASGVDTEAHRATLAAGGRTVAVIGTPIGRAYPSENAALQHQLAREHLVISQVPILRYERQNMGSNRFFFPERNATMSALTEATIIVEAGETSGTLIQARAALHQGRKLFILNSCFEQGLSWPAKLEAAGAVRVRTTDEILRALG